MYFRLILMFTCISIIPLFIMRGILLVDIKDRLYSERVENIRQHCETITEQMLEEGYFDGGSSDNLNNQMIQLASVYDGRIIVIDDTYTAVWDTYYRDVGKEVVSEDAMKCMRGSQVWHHNKELDIIELSIPIVSKSESHSVVKGAMLLSSSTATKTAAYLHIRWMSNFVFWVIAVILAVLAFFFSRVFSKPFKALAKTINHVSEGHFDEKVNLEGYNEIVQISDAFNKMLVKLKTLEDSRQEFVSNVSHELKTPMTSIKVLADSLNMQPDAPKELYQDFMKDIVEEIDRENQIINDLLSLVKMDKKAAELNLTSVNINEMLELILKRLRPIAGKRNIELAFEGFRTVITDVDEVKLTLAFSNLVENGIKYNVAGGWVKVSLDADHDYFYVKVSDSGIGIAEEYQDRIFERFYRVDKARSRETGGTGLGLAITKNIILMHGGEIKVKSREEQGTVFMVRIPLGSAKKE